MEDSGNAKQAVWEEQEFEEECDVAVNEVQASTAVQGIKKKPKHLAKKGFNCTPPTMT